jgi:hypothetical protein
MKAVGAYCREFHPARFTWQRMEEADGRKELPSLIRDLQPYAIADEINKFIYRENPHACYDKSERDTSEGVSLAPLDRRALPTLSPGGPLYVGAYANEPASPLPLRGISEPAPRDFADTHVLRTVLHSRLLLPNELEAMPDADKWLTAEVLRADSRGLYMEGYHYRDFFALNNAALLYASIDESQKQAECLLGCLASLSPIGHAVEIRKTASKLHSLLRSRPNLPRFYEAELSRNIATACFDCGDMKLALHVFRHAGEIYRQSSLKDCGLVSSMQLTASQNLNNRRLGHIVGMEDIDKGILMLSETAAALKDRGHTRYAAITLFSMECLYVHHGQDWRAYEFICEHERELMQGTKWNQFGVDLQRGYLLNRIGKRKESEDLLGLVLPQVRDLGFRPPSLRTRSGEWPFMADRVLGQDHPIVKDRGPMQLRGPCPFSAEDIKTLIG